jgi:hypothetical protein
MSTIRYRRRRGLPLMAPSVCFGNDLTWTRVGSVRKERTMLKPHLFATYALAAALTLVLITPALAQTPGGKKAKRLRSRRTRSQAAPPERMKTSRIPPSRITPTVPPRPRWTRVGRRRVQACVIFTSITGLLGRSRFLSMATMSVWSPRGGIRRGHMMVGGYGIWTSPIYQGSGHHLGSKPHLVLGVV